MRLRYVALASVVALTYSLHHPKLNLQLDQHLIYGRLFPASSNNSSLNANGGFQTSLTQEKEEDEEHFVNENKTLFMDSLSKIKAEYDGGSQTKSVKHSLDGIPNVDSRELKRKLYSLLGKIKTHPQAAIYALVSGEVPREHNKMFGNGGDNERENKKEKKKDNNNNDSHISSKITNEVGSSSNILLDVSNIYQNSLSEDDFKNSLYILQQLSQTSPEAVLGTRYPRVKRKSPGVMYLPINQPQSDPCAAPKGSKLMEALPLVFLSTVLSVADAVGNVVNNINSNNNNNNNNNDNNINNDNTNLAANINNANQVNIVPLGGRALRIARAIMNSIGRMALGVYDTIMPSITGKVDNIETEANNNDSNIQDKKREEFNATTKTDVNSFSNGNATLVKHEIREVSNLSSYSQKIPVNNISFSSSNATRMSDGDSITKSTNTNARYLTLIQERELDHILQLYAGSKRQKRMADFHQFKNTLLDAEKYYRNYLNGLQEQLKYID